MFSHEYVDWEKNNWINFAKEVNGLHELGKHTLYGRIHFSSGPWQFVLDTFNRRSAVNHMTSTDFTRMRAPFENHDGFTCEIYKSSLTSEIGKLFGMQDIKIGEEQFDIDYIIKSNNDITVWRLLRIDEIRILINSIPDIHLRVNSEKRVLSKIHPEAINEVLLETTHIIGDIESLRALKQLFVLILTNLCKFDSKCSKSSIYTEINSKNI